MGANGSLLRFYFQNGYVEQISAASYSYLPLQSAHEDGWPNLAVEAARFQVLNLKHQSHGLLTRRRPLKRLLLYPKAGAWK